MIIIKAPTAQTASDSLNLENPPTLTIGAEYGGFILRDSRYTSAYTQQKGSEFYGKPEPIVDTEIPTLKENEVILIREINPQTVAGVMRATGEVEYFSEDYIRNFWCYLYFSQREEIDLRVKRTLEFIEDKRLRTSHAIYNSDVTSEILDCISFIKEEIKEPVKMVKNDKNLETWVTTTPYNIVVRKSFLEDTSEMLTDPIGQENEVCISYIENTKRIIIYSKDHKINCREFSISKWGVTWGDNLKSGSPDKKIITEEDFSETIPLLTEYVKEKTYRH